MRLTVETGPLAGTVVSLDRDHPATLGSGPDCAIRVREAGVLPEHAVVKALRGEGFGLKALAAGVRVNGQAIEATPLNDGDIIELGTTRIAFGEVQKQGLPTIPGYRIGEVLGRGGMGIVYRAEQTSLHREVALKVLSRELTKDPQFVAKFVAEARAAAKLQHPNVVAVFDVEHDADIYFYSMELMTGSLEDELRQRGALPVDRALRVIADAAAGLAYAESLGIVHRDIKPDNLMLDQHGVVKIADLGLARSDDEVEEKAIGTPHFMAPEQVLKKEIDHRTDLYALGCTFYRLITGRTPFRGQSVKDILRAQVKDEAEPAHKVNGEVPAEVGAIVQRLMAKDPKDRYQTANDLLEDVQQLLQPPHKKGLWIGLAAAAVLVAGGAIYWAVNKPKEQTIVEKYRDNPEMLELATENEQLKVAAREDQATIALLTVRLGGQTDLQLAAALDQMAAQHPGTKAAIEAQQRAGGVREDVRAREAAAERRREQAEAHLATLRTKVDQDVAAGNFAAALLHVSAPPPAAIAADPTLTAGVGKLRDEVLAAARNRLATLQGAIETAFAGTDLAAVEAANKSIVDTLAERKRWPAELAAELDALQGLRDRGATIAAGLASAQQQTRWLAYATLLQAPDGVAAPLARLDFAAAAAAAERFCAGGLDDAASVRARGLQATLLQAERFAAAFRTAVAATPLPYPGGNEDTEQVTQWDLATGQLTVVDTSKRTGKERTVPIAEVSPEAWQVLADQVAPPAPGSRACFLTFVALLAHERAARKFLTDLDPRDDNSGTMGEGYPLGTVFLEVLRRRLPTGDEPWLTTLRDELDAAARLVSGLRALSEKRHLAAATHLEKALAEHPHSFLVMLLP